MRRRHSLLEIWVARLTGQASLTAVRCGKPPLFCKQKKVAVSGDLFLYCFQM
jgi:hypothetical protein